MPPAAGGRPRCVRGGPVCPARAGVRGGGAGAGAQVPAGDPSHCFVAGVEGHPLFDEPGQQRAAQHQRRHRDDQPEEQRQPEVGAEGVDGHQRTGVGRDQAVQDGQAGQGGNADPHQGDVGTAGHEDDHRDQQHDADLEEQGQPEDGRDQRHRPGQSPGTDLADDGVHDGVRAPGVGEQRAQHRAQTDQQTHRADGPTEPGGEARDDVERSHARDDPHHRGAQHQSQERVHLRPDDQHHHRGDAQEGGQHDLGVAGVGQRRGVLDERQQVRPGGHRSSHQGAHVVFPSRVRVPRPVVGGVFISAGRRSGAARARPMRHP